MAYDRDEYGYGRGVDLRQVDLRPRYGIRDSLDPNYQGGAYRGMRMRPGIEGQAAYGWERQAHRADLGQWGGWAGRYGEPREGRFDRHGLYRDPFDRAHPTNLGHGAAPQAARGERERVGLRGPMRGGPATRGQPRYDEDDPARFDGGVRGGTGYLRQFNRNSPALRGGRGGYDRAFGHADDRTGGYPAELRRERTHERDREGYNPAGYGGKFLPQPGSDPTGR